MLYCASYTVLKITKFNAVAQEWWVSWEGGGLQAPGPPRFLWGSDHATCRTLKRKMVDISSRSHPVKFFFSITSHFTCFSSYSHDKRKQLMKIWDYGWLSSWFSSYKKKLIFSQFFKTTPWLTIWRQKLSYADYCNTDALLWLRPNTVIFLRYVFDTNSIF